MNLPNRVYVMVQGRAGDKYLALEEDLKRFDQDGVVGVYELQKKVDLTRTFQLREHRKRQSK